MVRGVDGETVRHVTCSRRSPRGGSEEPRTVSCHGGAAIRTRRCASRVGTAAGGGARGPETAGDVRRGAMPRSPHRT
ncbi:hypothetical protein KPATCC21470_0138 [Kitasatospora purpeofusca]